MVSLSNRPDDQPGTGADPATLKVRIGYGLGTRTSSNEIGRFAELVDGLESRGFDSLWVSERIGTNCPDPVVAMSFAAARTERLKVGAAVMVLPGRNPVVLAKTLASLDVLSQGRVLPAFGLGIANSAEHQAFGVERRDRGGWFNEALPLMRRLWTENAVEHRGKRFDIDEVSLEVKPVQDPFEIWLGGRSDLELDRVGRHGDGWLPAVCTPEQVAKGRRRIEATASSHDREIDHQHYGALIPYRPDGSPVPEVMQRVLAERTPSADADQVVPQLADLPSVISDFVSVGFSKFVLVPTVEPSSWSDELDQVAAAALPLET